MAHYRAKKTGVLLVNLGSPEAPTPSKVRRYLREFLTDPRVVDLPRSLWWIILNILVLPFRPRKAAKAYGKIWTANGSPLILFTRQLCHKLSESQVAENVVMDYAMRYGQPMLAEKLNAFKAQHVNEIVILPLYPQYSSTTTASVYDAVNDIIRKWRHIPGLHFISDYHEHEAYIQAVADSITDYWRKHGRSNQLLMSFHGLPTRLTTLGDPYYYQCKKTAVLVAQRLSLNDNQWKLVFQSRFGRAEWLKPYCIEVLRELPQQGCQEVDVVCPGFAVDCLETLEEIAIANRDVFIAAGGESYRYIPALNDSNDHVHLIHELLAELQI